MKLLLLRTEYQEDYTQGIILINDEFYGYTLEDKVRFTDKIYGKTAIPAGFYELKNTISVRFQRKMPQVMRVPGFRGVRIHGGNSARDSLGCILVAKNTAPGKIWGSLGSDLTRKIDSWACPTWLEIINTRQW